MENWFWNYGAPIGAVIVVHFVLCFALYRLMEKLNEP